MASGCEGVGGRKRGFWGVVFVSFYSMNGSKLPTH